MHISSIGDMHLTNRDAIQRRQSAVAISAQWREQQDRAKEKKMRITHAHWEKNERNSVCAIASNFNDGQLFLGVFISFSSRSKCQHTKPQRTNSTNFIPANSFQTENEEIKNETEWEDDHWRSLAISQYLHFTSVPIFVACINANVLFIPLILLSFFFLPSRLTFVFCCDAIVWETNKVHIENGHLLLVLDIFVRWEIKHLEQIFHDTDICSYCIQTDRMSQSLEEEKKKMLSSPITAPAASACRHWWLPSFSSQVTSNQVFAVRFVTLIKFDIYRVDLSVTWPSHGYLYIYNKIYKTHISYININDVKISQLADKMDKHGQKFHTIGRSVLCMDSYSWCNKAAGKRLVSAKQTNFSIKQNNSCFVRPCQAKHKSNRFIHLESIGFNIETIEIQIHIDKFKRWVDFVCQTNWNI